ncbi:PaaI family thioesterase [Mesorhizobium sp. ASY16-5R]|uniref:PaaI family thioesterase n=1 Tax=Mesorhizobium sp. ASY16-5R TaxID=3445772 RepID=UPI003F9F12F8
MTEGTDADPDLIAAGWKLLRPSAFITLVGPFYSRTVEGKTQYCFRVATKHDNTQDRPHGGMIMSFMDEVLGHSTQIARPNDSFSTIGFDCQFIDGSAIGDLVVAETEIVRATRSLMFMRGECKVGNRVIATANGIWKVLLSRGTER